MLQYSTVEPHTLEILKGLLEIPELKDFSLVGGTALSLYYGHRISIDIDLFSTSDFENETLIDAIQSRFPGFSYRNTHNAVGIFGMIDGIKLDLIKHHHHPLLYEPNIENGIRLLSLPDLMAMKIAAIMKRGVKKDFWDIAELLQHFTIDNFISYYTEKYPSNQLLVSVPFALTYFIDAEESEDPVCLKGQTWESVKKIIQQKVSEYLK